jgi:hypothetical protein
LVGVNISRDSCSIRRTETVRKLTRGSVTFGGAVGILIDVTSCLVRAVRAIHLVVTEESLGDALAIAALELVLRANRLVGVQVRKRLAGL